MVVGELCRRLSEQVEGSPLVHLRIVALGGAPVQGGALVEGGGGALAEGCAPEEEARRAVVFVRTIAQ